MGGCSTDIALDSFDVRLKGAFDPLTFNYFLRVRREDRARFACGRTGEGDVCKATVVTPSGEMTGTRV